MSLFVGSCGVREHVSTLQGAGMGGSCPTSVNWNTSSPIGTFKKIRDFSQRNLGKQVGKGECWDLADQALNAVPAVTYHKNQGPDADYKWGDVAAIYNPGSVKGSLRPGQILQFRNAKFSWRQGSSNVTRTARHHTAVVSAVSNDGKDICVLHQNSGGVRNVQYGYYRIAALTEGTVWGYSPIPK